MHLALGQLDGLIRVFVHSELPPWDVPAGISRPCDCIIAHTNGFEKYAQSCGIGTKTQLLDGYQLETFAPPKALRARAAQKKFFEMIETAQRLDAVRRLRI